MKLNTITSVLAAAALATAGLACGGGSGQSSAQPAAGAAAAAPKGSASAAMATAAQKAQARPAAPSFPKNAQWTILCTTVRGTGHVERSRQMKENLLANTKLKDWHVLHQDEESHILYGYYETFDDPKKAKERDRAQRDRKMIDGLVDARGNRPFSQAIFWPLTAPDPVAPAEWNLVNAPPEMHYTLEVAVYKDSPERKQAAVESVRAARERGLEAFYYHGETASSVCIGAWPKGAVREEGAEAVTSTANQDVDLFVLPPGMTPRQEEIRTKDGRTVRAVKQVMDVVDPSLQATQIQFPHHAINGEVRAVKGKDGRLIPEPSVVMVIPRKAPSLLDPGLPGAGEDAFTEVGAPGGRKQEGTEPAAAPQPARPQAPGAGRLKTIGS